MTAPTFAPFSESYPSVEPLFGYRGPRPLVDSKAPRLAARRPFNYGVGREARPCFTPSTSTDLTQLGRMWSSLLELLPQGVIVLSRTLQPIYWNSKAKQLCQAQMGIDLTQAKLPDAVSEACHRLLRDSQPNSASLFVKDERSDYTSLRISARWLASIPGQPDLFPTQHIAGTQQPGTVQGAATGEQSWI
jgi:PAS domain-containing protein